MTDFPTRQEWYAARDAKLAAKTPDKAEIQKLMDDNAAYLKATFTDEERNRIVAENYWGAD